MSENTPKEVYDSFIKERDNKMRNKYISIDNNNQCYLIKDNNWVNDFINNYNNKGTNKNDRYYYKRSNIKKPDFLNDFDSLINYLKERKIFKMVNKELMEFSFKYYELMMNKMINYYIGNNKIIIEYTSNDEKYALLIFYSINYYNNRNILIIHKNNEENKQLYKELLNNISYNTLISND